MRTALLSLVFFTSVNINAQNALEQIGYLLDDALFYSDYYITPMTDASVYQASSSWFTSPKRKEKWTVNAGVFANVFFVPSKDRDFIIRNSDFKFFEIDGATEATVPTSLGGSTEVVLIGEIENQEIRFESPKGVDQETMIYPYIKASLEFPYGFELNVRYSTKTKLKKGNYQVYGAGIRYNFSDYIATLKNRKLNAAIGLVYSKEDVVFDFIDVETAYGNLGINQLNGIVDTWHFNFLFSKEFKNFELVGNVVTNFSTFDYKVFGPEGGLDFIPVRQIINESFNKIERDKINVIYEISGVYYINKLALQSSFAFGKFANLNFGVQYQFNK